ncbi:MAG: monooxygenase [Mycobacterium sp.]|nr:monooxygenase [Mycobacterium sp.]
MWRLIKQMDATGTTWCAPRLRDPSVTALPLMDFSSGYVQRSIDQFPKAGSKQPWAVRMNYLVDRMTLSRGSVDDGTMEFGTGAPAALDRAAATAS